MVDTVTIPATGTGTATPVVATDDCAGIHYQRVKLVDGTADSTALIAGDATNGLDVDVTRLPALPAGTNNIGDVDVLTVPADPFGVNADAASGTGSISAKLRQIAVTGVPITSIAAGDTNIGNVDVVSVPAPLSTTGGGAEATALRVTLANDSTGLVSVDDNSASLSVDWNGTQPVTGSGTATGALRVELANNGTGLVGLTAGTNTNEVVGDVAHSVAAAGNPVLIAGVAQAHDDTAPPNRVDAESDATRLATDYDGAVFVRPHGPQVWTYHVNGSSALTDTSVHAAPGAGLSLYIGTITFSSGAATAINMFLEEGASTIVGPYYLEAIAGRGMSVTFNPPRKVTQDTALTITTSAAIAHSVDITGFTAQG